MKLNCHYYTLRLLALAILFSIATSSFGANLPEEITEPDRFGASIGSGNTNKPLLALDWFIGPRNIEFCRVSQSGKVYAALDAINWAIQGGYQAQLDQTNLGLLMTVINALPPPISQTLPKERLLIVRGIRTNQWFEFTYDRANVPKEVEKLYEITGAGLKWFIPEIQSNQIVRLACGSRGGTQFGIYSFSIAANANVAVTASDNGVQVCDLKQKTVRDILSLKILSQFQSYGNKVAAINPDGNIIAIASDYGICAVDLKTPKLLWTANALEHNGRYNKHLVIGGDKGQFLFTAGAHTLERWDLATGKKLGVLATNQPTIKFLQTSRDGKVLVAGFDDSSFMDTMSVSFTVWKVDNDNPVAHIDEPQRTGFAISPDGQKIALSVFGSQNLKIWDWTKNSTHEVPLRTPIGSLGVGSLFWSPDGSRFAAEVDTYPSSIVFYDVLNWKPLAHWSCRQIMREAEFDFASDGWFYEFQDSNLNGLDVKLLNELE